MDWEYANSSRMKFSRTWINRNGVELGRIAIPIKLENFFLYVIPLVRRTISNNVISYCTISINGDYNGFVAISGSHYQYVLDGDSEIEPVLIENVMTENMCIERPGKNWYEQNYDKGKSVGIDYNNIFISK